MVETALDRPQKIGFSTALSPSRNLRGLLSPPPGSLHPVDGLRALSILWVILFHATKNLGYHLQNRFNDIPFRILNRGFMGVDVFFVLSGFLIARLLLKERDRRGTIDLGRFYLRRALRILPAYYVALAVYCALTWETCETGVWANLLYVNNFLPRADQCMEWSWSLAIEEQFYLVFPLLLILVYRLKRFRLTALFVALLAAVAIRGGITAYYGLHLPGAGHTAHLELLRDALYIKPYSRYGGLLSGVIVAYLIAETPCSRWLTEHSRFATVAVLVALAYVAYLSCRLQPVFLYRWPALVNLAYYAAAGYLFSVAVALVLWAALVRAGIGRWIARGLSLRLWYPIGQLSYSAYLIHLIVIEQGVGRGLLAPPRSISGFALDVVAVTALTFAASTVLHLAVERPIMNLRRG